MMLLAIWIGTLLAAALVCLLAIILSWPWWSAAIVSVPCAVVGGVCLAFWWRARRHAQTAALHAATPERASVSAAAREGVERAIRDAMRRLRESGLGRGLRRRSAGPIPWYAVIGDPVSGKTSVLRASGFELLAAALPVTGAGGVNIWCSGEAVCWELSGSGLERGLAEWRPVLEGLAKQRPRRPLDGVIVTLAADQLVTGEAEALEAGARRVRACLDELEQQLHWVIPVHLLIAKLDAVPDFEGFWRRAEPALRRQPWGATLPEWDASGADVERAVAGEWKLLESVLHARALRQLAGAELRDPSALLRFPGRFARLGVRLSRYVKALTEIRPCRSRVALRGFYLSSAAPSVAESDARKGSLLGEAQLASLLPHTRSNTLASSFLADLFRLAIAPDGRGAARSSHWRRRHGKRQWALLTGAVVGLLLAALPAFWSYLENTRLIEETRRELAGLTPASAVIQSEPGSAAGLDALLASLERLDAAASRFHVFGWWGAYAARDLRSAVGQAYRERLAQVARGPLQAQLLATLRSIGDLPRLDWTGVRQAVDHLKLYSMLTHPERLDVPWASGELLSTWERARQRGAYRDDGPLEPHILRLLASWAEGSLPAWEEDHDSVGRVRTRLLGLPLDEIEFAWLERAARDVPPIRAEQIFTGAAARYWLARGNAEVPGLYTRAGWERIRPLLDTTTLAEAELGVLAPTGTAPGWTSAQLRAHYFERYGRAWRSFVSALRSESASGAVSSHLVKPLLNETMGQLEALAEAEGPLVRLFQRFGENVRFPLVAGDKPLERAASLASTALGVPLPAAPSPLEEQFRGLLHFAFGDAANNTPAATSALAEYQNELRMLLAALRENEDSSGAPVDADALLGRASLAVQRLLAPLNDGDRSVVQGLLTDPIENGRAGVRDRDAARLAERWRREVMLPGQRLFARYPFAANAAEDVSADELQGFLAPKTGSLWRFVETELTVRLSESGGRYENRERKGQEPLSDDLLECLGAARELRDALFGEAAAAPSVSLAVRLASTGADVSSVAFQVDGQSAEGVGKWLPVKWSGGGAASGAAVVVRGPGFGDEIRRMGPFGLMRLLATGELRSSAAEEQILEASWQLNHGLTRVTVQLRPDGSGLSLRPSAFQRMKCPFQPFAAPRRPS